MKRASALEPGTFVRIPLEDGSFGYGRVLSNPYIAFYNHRTEEPSSDLDVIGSKPLLFTQAVRLFDYDRWANLGKRELEGEVAKPVVQFMQDLADFRKCTIFDSEGMEKEVGPEECIGLERAAVWDVHHIERRLLDTFLGLPNEDEIRARVRLE
ncbi:MAG TPA: immunity 26/phosphotriesterase HocA family protein [Thermoanaerobaculia bacterium]|nr:immunity 26/phosphotriesterase HocA family protein [Thermoanaerobaculia bacterium]